MAKHPRHAELERLAADLGPEWDAYRQRLFGCTEAKGVALVEPMAEALAWLLPDRRPAPRM